jgi:hypothetical protein
LLGAACKIAIVRAGTAHASQKRATVNDDDVSLGMIVQLKCDNWWSEFDVNGSEKRGESCGRRRLPEIYAFTKELQRQESMPPQGASERL